MISKELRVKSLLVYLDDDSLQYMLLKSSVFEVKNDYINKDRESVYIVIEGKVLLEEDEEIIDEILAGRSLETHCFFNEIDYKYKWRCEGDCKVLQIPKNVLKDSLKERKFLFEYLSKLSTYPELRNIKTDLNLFGISEEFIWEFIAKLQIKNIEDVSNLDNSFNIVAEGSVKVFLDNTVDKYFISEYRTGDYFMFYDENLVLESEHVSFWSTSLLDYSKDRAEKFREITKLLDPLKEEKKQKERSAGQMAISRELFYEDNDFDVEDFEIQDGEKFVLDKMKSVLQQDEMDCGAACLSTVCLYYHKNISLAACRTLINVTREGASLFSLKIAAEKIGFDAIGITSGITALRDIKMPMIALMQYHFVVVYEVGVNTVKISDPAVGLIDISMDQFKDEFSGNALLLKPNDKLALYPESAKTWNKYWKLLKGIKLEFMHIFLAGLVSFVFTLLLPLFLQIFIDEIYWEKKHDLLKLYGVIFMGITIFGALVSFAKEYLIVKVTALLELKFSVVFMKHVLRLPISYFAVRNIGDVTTRVEEINNIKEFVSVKTVGSIIDLTTLMVYCVILWLYDFRLILAVTLLMPFILFVLYFLGEKVKKIYMSFFQLYGKSVGLFYEFMNSYETVKALNVEYMARSKWGCKNDPALKEKFKFEKIIVTLESIKEFINEFIKVVLIGLSAFLYVQDEFTLGQVIAVSSISGHIVAPLLNVYSLWDDFKKVQVSFLKVDDVFTASPESEGKLNESENWDISIHNVNFQYGSELSPMVLDNVSLNIKSGETVAFVGGSGSGKTTLGYMLPRLYTPTQGYISVGGTKIDEFSLKFLRENIQIILQENNLFSGTIIENIALEDGSPSIDRVIDAAKKAQAHDFISKLPDGYHTILGENGEGPFSGGQRQRLNIARAFYKNSKILVLDEATASLDGISEKKIMESFKDRKDRTTIIIAHRLNTITYADKIVVLDKGQIIEQGSHQELINLRGYYYDLFRKQLNT